MQRHGKDEFVKRELTSVNDVLSIALKIVRRWYYQTVSLMKRLDFLSSNRPVSGKQEILYLTLIPMLTFGAVCLVAWISDVAYRPGCNSTGNFMASLFFQPISPSTCDSVPFLSDVPMIILSISCPFALVAYRLLRRRLASLFQALEATGLLSPQDPTAAISRGIKRLERAVDLTPIRSILLFFGSVGMVTWLYSQDLSEGNLFNTLARVAPDGTTNAEQLRATWWANYHHHPLLAALCILIGSVGVMYAFRAGWLYLRLGGVLFATRKTPPDDLPTSYVPKWKDKSYGWSPVTAVLMLLYASTINFAISMIAIFDMLRNEPSTLAVAVFFAALGIVSNMAIILTSFFRMVAAHRAVEKGLREELLKPVAQRSLSMTSEEYAFAKQELAVWRRIPVASFVGSAIKILPGLYALFQFIRIFSGNGTAP